jgi:hypothetical protein
MKTIVSLILAGCLSLALNAAEPKDDVLSAAKALSQKPNYSWTSSMEMAGSNFNMPPLEGQTEKDGFTVISREFNGNTSTAVFKGEKGAVKTDEGWKTEAELGDPQPGANRGGFMGRMMLRNRTPASEVVSLLEKVQAVKAGEKGLYSADLTEAGAKELLSFGRRPGQAQNRPDPKNAKGSVKFTVKDGLLTQYEVNVKGLVVFGQDQTEREMDRTTKVEIKEIGTTKVTVPEDAKKKF